MSRMGRVKQLSTFGSQRREACLDRKASGSAYKLWTWFIQTSSNVYREDQAMQMQLEDSLWRYYQQVQITAWIVLYCNECTGTSSLSFKLITSRAGTYERSETIQTKYLRLDGQVHKYFVCTSACVSYSTHPSWMSGSCRADLLTMRWQEKVSFLLHRGPRDIYVHSRKSYLEWSMTLYKYS